LQLPSTELVVEDLALERGGRMLLRGLGFTLRGGEALVVTGPNGAGKSTLLRALAGLLPPAAGRIRLQGAGFDGERMSLGAHYIGHADGLKPSLTARENLAFWATALDIGAGLALTPLAALERLGVGALAELPAAYLSAGQKRRVALARLLAARRPLWLLDEPTTALDAPSRALLEELVMEHLAGGGSAVVSTHAPLERLLARRLALGLG
jgi:heme exporter protein A